MGKSMTISEFLASIDFTDEKYQVIDVATVEIPEDATFGFVLPKIWRNKCTTKQERNP